MTDTTHRTWVALIAMYVTFASSAAWTAEPKPPGAPGIGVATPGSARATITFSPPASTGGRPVTGYIVTSSLGQSVFGRNSPIAFTGLKNGMNYTFTVRAVNAAGVGPASTPSNTVVPNPQFWIEPRNKTLIGVGQTISVYSAFKDNLSSFTARYIEPTSVQWNVSPANIVTLSSDGELTGLKEGAATVTARYSSYTSQIEVRVMGTLSRKSIQVPGQGTRSFLIYSPNLDAISKSSSSRPLLLSLHGGGGSGMLQAAMSSLNELAQSQGIYVAYLEGSGFISTYNGGACCGYAQTNEIDDVAYANAVIDEVTKRFPIQTAQIFSTGFSNGGIMSHRLACAMADRLAGIAAVGGASGEFDSLGNRYYTCSNSRPIPVLHIHASNDRNYPIGGGTGDGLSRTSFYSVPSTIGDWVSRNNLKPTYVLEQVSATTRCLKYKNALDPHKPSAPVTLCLVEGTDYYDPASEIVFGGGHSWPGGVKSITSKSDVPVADFSASQYLWQFFSHAN